MAGSSLKIENLTIGDNAAVPPPAAAATSSSEKIPKANDPSKRGYGVILLDAWNMRSRKRPKKSTEAAKTVSNSSAPVIRKKCVWNPELLKGIDPWSLRKTESHSVPVVVEKDPTSDIPETDMKKFLVLKNSTLGEFVDFVRMRIIMSRKKPMFVYFKNTKPSMDALMCAIDEQNMDEEDGFLHMAYSGEERREVCGSNEEQKCLEPVMFRARI